MYVRLCNGNLEVRKHGHRVYMCVPACACVCVFSYYSGVLFLEDLAYSSDGHKFNLYLALLCLFIQALLCVSLSQMLNLHHTFVLSVALLTTLSLF